MLTIGVIVILTLSRVVAALVGVGTFVFLFLYDSWHADNLFLVPDLVLCLVLLVGAVLPARLARPGLLFGFGLAAGVLMTSVASYAVRGAFGAVSLLGVLACLGCALALYRGATADGAARRHAAPS